LHLVQVLLEEAFAISFGEQATIGCLPAGARVEGAVHHDQFELVRSRFQKLGDIDAPRWSPNDAGVDAIYFDLNGVANRCIERGPGPVRSALR
jgi:hypothetical protein